MEGRLLGTARGHALHHDTAALRKAHALAGGAVDADPVDDQVRNPPKRDKVGLLLSRRGHRRTGTHSLGRIDVQDAGLAVKEPLAGGIQRLNGVEKVEVLPYHTLGTVKYKALNIPYPLENIPEATDEDVERALSIIKSV